MKSRVVGALVVGCALSAGCVGHPLEPLDQVVLAAHRQETRLPTRNKIDFLFVVDNSGSMCQEQDNLGRNFDAFARYLYDDLGSTADYRIAITSTDLQNPAHGGRFLASPAAPVPSRSCTDAAGEPFVPDTADCPADLPPIIASGPGQVLDEAELARRFRCMTTLGTTGYGFEKGLEAMRLALSCQGPNADAFNACCVDGRYDPACVIDADTPEPQFLRPDASLVVVFISDEDDCSEPAANPGASRRVICKYGVADGDGDGVPDGYRDPALCADDPATCFARECGGLDAQACRAARCMVPTNDNSSCAWARDALTPVDDYRRFLSSLKADPTSDILVAAIVGQRAYTDAGSVITWQPGPASTPECDPEHGAFEPSEACCPDGVCRGAIQTTCSSSNGEAFAGHRYLALAEDFGPNGIGCPAGAEPGGPLSEIEDCASICTDDFAAPLRAIGQGSKDILSTYCLDKRPACQVMDADGERPCAIAAEYAEPANYRVRVQQTCARTVEQGGLCARAEDRRLGTEEYELLLNEPGCPGGAAVRLDAQPQPGAEVVIDFMVAVQRQ